MSVIYSNQQKGSLIKDQLPIITSFSNAAAIGAVNSTIKSSVHQSLMSGLDPFEGIVKEEDSTSAESRFSLDSNDIFDFEEDAVRVRSQNIMGEKSLASQRASGQARVYSSRGFSQSSKEAQKLVTLLKDFDNTPGTVSYTHLTLPTNREV